MRFSIIEGEKRKIKSKEKKKKIKLIWLVVQFYFLLPNPHENIDTKKKWLKKVENSLQIQFRKNFLPRQCLSELILEKDRLGVEEDGLELTLHRVEPNVLPLHVSRVVLCGVQVNGDSDSLLVLIIPVGRLIKDRHDQCRDSGQGHGKDAVLPKGVPNSKVHPE